MPTLGDIAQMITAALAFAAFVQSVHNSRKIEVVHRATNSMKDELVSAVRGEATAEGIAEGRRQKHDEGTGR